MPENRDLITEVRDRVLERIDLSDRLTDQKLTAVADQTKRDIQDLRDDHTRDKAEAITRSTNEHKNTREAVSLVGGRVTVLENALEQDVKPVLGWFHDEGSKLGGRVSTLEQLNVKAQAEKAERDEADRLKAASQDGERRGAWKVWALVYGTIVAIGGAAIAYADTIQALAKRLFSNG